ncbi:MAG: hypothetical protein IPG49_07270 [Proteobacteria bacterium]|nr:hypothetical protein [Pseudomonadota bacterium]
MFLAKLTLLGLLLSGCVHLPPHVRQELECEAGGTGIAVRGPACLIQEPIVRQQAAFRRQRALSIADVPFATGQIILIERPGAASLFLSLMSARFAPWIHAGVIVVDDGTPYVYEAFGIMMPRFSGSPTDGMRGGARRVPLASFLKRDGIIAVYDPPVRVNREVLAQFARRHVTQRTPFDGYFDSSDPQRMYCVEFVAHGLRAAGGDWPTGAPVSANPSAAVALRWLKIAGPELLLAGDLVEPGQLMWQGSRRYSPAQIDSYFALKRELHRRFTAEQKLGNLLQWRWQSLHLRPAVNLYFQRGMAAQAPDPIALAASLFEEHVPLDADEKRMSATAVRPGP